MISIVAWATERGVSPFHPGTWSAEDCAAFTAAKRRAYKDKWRYYRDVVGVVHTLPRETLREWVRNDLAQVEAPPPSRPYRSCPCHQRPRLRAEDRTKMSHGLEYIHTFRTDWTAPARKWLHKRAEEAAVLTAAPDIFTQDLEDMLPPRDERRVLPETKEAATG